MKKNVMILLLGVFSLASCNSEKEGVAIAADNFDRGAMLVNWADQIIIPSFQNFSKYTFDLQTATQSFTEDPTTASLEGLQAAFREAYLAYQSVAPFGLGKAETLNYHNFLNIYPTDTAAIGTKIRSNEYNLELPSSMAAQGFPAMDFLLNGLGDTKVETLQYYTSDLNAPIYCQYLLDVATRIHRLTSQVLTDWNNGYRDEFVSNTSSSSTGSVDKFTNDFIMYYEKDLRTGKIGIPAGVFTGNPVPGTTEAYYTRGLSRQLYLEALQTVKEFFNGRHVNDANTGPSFRQYLEYLYGIRGGVDLATLINSRFDEALEQGADLNADLSTQVIQDNQVMLSAFDALQKNVVLLKIDMLQAMDISVDYVDTDGD